MGILRVTEELQTKKPEDIIVIFSLLPNKAFPCATKRKSDPKKTRKKNNKNLLLEDLWMIDILLLPQK